MRFVLFYHSLISDWNHGTAHFLRGIVSELGARGHDVRVFEPGNATSVQHLVEQHGEAALSSFHVAYPGLYSERYGNELDLDRVLDRADAVIVHESNDPALIARIGAHRAKTRSYALLFHDTHHRSVSAPEEIRACQLQHYDGVLAFGRVIRDLYLEHGWAARAWTWHEAADIRVFRPHPHERSEGDLVWIGNWGDNERAADLREMLIEPVRALRLRALVHGVRYPGFARRALATASITYAGWLPNFAVPAVFARHGVTLHVPRRPYVEALPGIPSIRVFEALACGIPLVSAPWRDEENLFKPGADYLVAKDGLEIRDHLRVVLADQQLAADLAAHGRATILDRHTCGHRVDELLAILGQLGRGTSWNKELVA